jgi:two-component system OmpR family sensor kinase
MEADIFEPFKRVDTDGVEVTGFGLGLAIAKYAVERHGGSIRAMAGVSGGLRVVISLPRGMPSA